MASLATNFCASLPISPSVVVTKGVKCLLLSKHGCRYFFLFFFLFFYYFFHRRVPVGIGFQVGDSDVNDAVHLFHPESSDSYIVPILCVCRVGTVLYGRFNLHCAWSECLS